MDAAALVIDAGVPLPPVQGKRIDWAAAFVRMQVGDSFALPVAVKSVVAKAITDYKKATGQGFTLREVDGGIRVWRVR